MTTSTPRTDGRRPGRFRHLLRTRRGSILVVVLLLSALLALSVGSYLALNLTTARLTRQSHRQSAAFHLAEAGAEEALWSFNRAHESAADAWTGWATSGKSAWKKFEGFEFGGGTSGTCKVFVTNTTPAAKEQPKAVALSSVAGSGAPSSGRMIEITLARRSFFANGLVAKETLKFAGTNTSVDSWNSDPDDDPATPPVPYHPLLKSDKGSIATGAVLSSSMLVNSADVWGYVATGGAPPEVGVGGSIKGADTPPGVEIDPTHISTDFVADLPLVTAPPGGTVIASVGSTLGTAGLATQWRCPSIKLAGTTTLTILGDVTLVLTATTGHALEVSGSATINIPAGSSLAIYAEADVKIAGNGLANANPAPGSCRIVGTHATPSGQSIHIAGNGTLLGTVYAPNAQVSVNGNGDVMGAIVAQSITFTGNAKFHYDESLAAGAADAPFGMRQWRELTDASERAAWDAVFAGW